MNVRLLSWIPLFFALAWVVPTFAQRVVVSQVCAAEIAAAREAHRTAGLSPQNVDSDPIGCVSPETARGTIAYSEQSMKWEGGSHPLWQAKAKMAICFARAQISQCGASARPVDSIASSPTRPATKIEPAAGNQTPSAAKAPTTARQPTSNEENAKQKARSEADSALERAKGVQDGFDKIRQGRAKRHHPEGEAHQCLTIKKAGLYGGFNNSCAVPVTYLFCQYQPKKDSWGEWFDCEKGKFGLWSVKANSGATGHTNGAVMNYWFACKEGFYPLDVEFVSGQGLRGRCVK